MDWASLAAGATGFLAPYLVKAGEKTAESVGEKLPGAAAKLWGAVTDRFRGRPAAETAAADLVAAPEDPDNQAAFCKELRKALEADPSFGAEFRQLLDAARGIVNTGSGAMAIGGGVAAGAGGVAVGGDVQGNIVVGKS